MSERLSKSLKSKKTTQPHIPVRIYKLSHLVDTKFPDEPNSWTDFGHTLTIVSRNPRIGSKTEDDDLYVDHVHIHSENWNWLQKPHELVWKQGTGDDLIEGFTCVSGDSTVGSGMVRFKEKRSLESAQLHRLQPTYTLDLSTDAGAELSDENMLTWDTSTTQWENAYWENGALKYSYWTESCSDSRTTDFGTGSEFTEMASGQIWTLEACPNRHEENARLSIVTISSERKLTFRYTNGPDPTNRIFPYEMCVQLSPLGEEITGGAMLCEYRDARGTVYAIKGKEDNLYSVGSYTLLDQDSNQALPQKLATHAKKLIIDNKPVLTSTIAHNRLTWHSLTTKQAAISQLPKDGFVEFSPDGSQIVASSFNHVGERQSSPRLPGLTTPRQGPVEPEPVEPEPVEPEPVERVERIEQAKLASLEPLLEPVSKQIYAPFEGTEYNLSVTQLINMNPVGYTTDEQLIDEVESKSMEDFYKILQYYMPVDLRNDFIGPNPPDIGDLEAIAKDNPANDEFYASLSVPYLTAALKNSEEDSTKKLNALRAQRYLKDAAGESKIYQNQAGKLYNRQWLIKFPLMQDFLDDQNRNTPEQHADIDAEAERWLEDLQRGMDYATDFDQVSNMVDQAVTAGKNYHYWAFKLFRRLCSQGNMGMIQQQLSMGGSSSTVSFQIKRYDSILTLLDPSGFFAKQYHEMMSVMIITTAFPSKFDFGENFDEVKLIGEELIAKFIETYEYSEDPAIQERVDLLKESMQRGIVSSTIGLLGFVVSESGGQFVWARICGRMTTEWVKKYGQGTLKFLEATIPFFGVAALGLLINNAQGWNEMSPNARAYLVNNCLFLLVLFARKAVKAIAIYSTTSLFDSIKVFLWGDISEAQLRFTSGFRKWLLRNAEVKNVSQSVVYRKLAGGDSVIEYLGEDAASFEESYSRLTKTFGRSLDEFMATRFSAVASALALALSAWSLSEATTPIGAASSTIFLIASTLDLVAAIGEWGISLDVTEIGGIAISQVTSVLGPMSFIGCVVGFILLIVMLSQNKPKDPVDEFVERDDVKQLGLYMEKEAAIDYLQVILDSQGLAKSVGVSFNYDSQWYLTMDATGALTPGPTLTHSYSTVFSIDTDYSGLSTIFSKVPTTDDTGKVSLNTVALVVQGSDTVIMRKKLPSDEDAQRQWKATCTREVNYHDPEERKYLQSAFFTLESFYRRGYFLAVKDEAITIEETENPQEWKLNMEGMAPGYLSVPNMKFLMPNTVDMKFVPHLEQIGSLSSASWTLSSKLPSYLQIDRSSGVIKCIEEPPEPLPTSEYLMTVENSFGSVSAEFFIEVSQADTVDF